MILFKRLLTRYVSDIDLFLQKLRKEGERSPSQQAEVDKARRVRHPFAKPKAAQGRHLWKNF